MGDRGCEGGSSGREWRPSNAAVLAGSPSGEEVGILKQKKIQYCLVGHHQDIINHQELSQLSFSSSTVS